MHMFVREDMCAVETGRIYTLGVTPSGVSFVSPGSSNEGRAELAHNVHHFNKAQLGYQYGVRSEQSIVRGIVWD